LNHLSPVQALQSWLLNKPNLFKSRVYDLTGLDSQPDKFEPERVEGFIGSTPQAKAI
jgi:hypothetical protein